MFSRHKTIFIIIIIAVNICLALGFYLNAHFSAVDDLNVSVSPDEINQDNLSGQEQEYSRIDDPMKQTWTRTWNSFASWWKHNIALFDKNNPELTDDEIAQSIEQKIDQPVDKKDLTKAALIVLKKLDSEETAFLYKVGNKPNPSKEELKKARTILLNKLTQEDINTLRELGAKYGKTLKILDPSVPID